MNREHTHLVVVRKRAMFLRRMMQTLAGDAMISLEGDLGRCSFPEALIVPPTKPSMPERQDLDDGTDFVILRLEQDTVEPIFQQVMKAGLKEAIVHIQIVRGRVRELGAYDHFHRECVVAGPGITASLLETMRDEQLIWSYSVQEEWSGD